MTTTKMSRCTHCGSAYSYHPSCYGFMPEYNDSRYCPDCAKAVYSALESVPIKVSRKAIPTTDYTEEEIIRAQAIRCNLSVDEVREYGGAIEIMLDPTTRVMTQYSAILTKEGCTVTKEIWWDKVKNAPDECQRNFDESDKIAHSRKPLILPSIFPDEKMTHLWDYEQSFNRLIGGLSKTEKFPAVFTINDLPVTIQDKEILTTTIENLQKQFTFYKNLFKNEITR